MRAPIRLHRLNEVAPRYPGLLSENPVEIDASIRAALTPGTPEYSNFRASMDHAVTELRYLADRGVPVLWRPFHEMNASHFWWGVGPDGSGGSNSAADFQELWAYVFDYFVNVQGLHNLVWVFSVNWSGTAFAPLYPGDDLVDVVGVSAYGSPTNTCPDDLVVPADQTRAFDRLRAAYDVLSGPEFGGKPIAAAEVDYIPDASQLLAEGMKVAWFLPWHWPSVGCNLEAGVLEQLYGYNQGLTANEIGSPLFGDGQDETSSGGFLIESAGDVEAQMLFSKAASRNYFLIVEPATEPAQCAVRDGVLDQCFSTRDRVPIDVWHFATPEEVARALPFIGRRLGRRKDFSTFLIEGWRRDGIVRG